MTSKNSRTGSLRTFSLSFLKMVLLTALFFFGPILSLPAQNRRFVTEQRFVQQLAWVGDEYVSRYEVIIERKEGEEYRRYRQESTELPRLRINLPLGNYRYHVIPYDFFDQPGEASDWITIDVSSATVISVEVQTEDDSYTLFPLNTGQLVPGVKGIVIKNPDELETKDGVLIIDKQELLSGSEKQVEMFVMTAWAPLFPIYGGMNQLFGQEIFLSGAALRLGFIFIKPKLLNPGLELSTSWYAIDTVLDTNTVNLQTGVMDINILVQKRSPSQKLAGTLRAGGGFTFQIGNIDDEQELYFLSRIAPHVSLDISFLWLALKYVYFETGLNYTHFLTARNPSGYFRPWVGIGWQF